MKPAFAKGRRNNKLDMQRSPQRSKTLVHTSWLWLTSLFCACKQYAAEHVAKNLHSATPVAAAWSERVLPDEVGTTQCAPHVSRADKDLGIGAHLSEIGGSLLQVAYGQRHRHRAEARDIGDEEDTQLHEILEMPSDVLAENTEKVDQHNRQANGWAGVPPVVTGDEEHMKTMDEIAEEFKMALLNEQQHIEALQEQVEQQKDFKAPNLPHIKAFTMDKTLSLMEVKKSSIVRVAAEVKDGSNARLTVTFRHKGQDFSYTLFPDSVYTETAQIYDGDQLIPVEAPRTFKLRDKGRWASITLHEGGGVQGIFEANGYFIKISPVSRQAPQIVKALAHHHDGSHEAHLIRLVAPSAFFERCSRSRPSLLQRPVPKLPFDEASHLPDAHGRDPWVEEAANVASTQGWGGVKWHPGCYSGDASMHEMLLGFVADKAARDLFDSSKELQRNLEVSLHEASFIFEMQMNIKLKLNYLKMSNDEAEFDACKKKQGQNRDSNYEIALHKLELLRQLTRDGAIPWHAANHLFTGCADGSSGTVGLAYEGTGCQCCHNVGVTLISPHESYQAWDTFAHELGHNLNGSHSFEEGQGVTGGIMDYGNGKLNGHYQFNTKYRKTDMCGHINKFGPRCKDNTGKSMFHPVPATTDPAQADHYNVRVVVAAVTGVLVLLFCLGLCFLPTTRVKAQDLRDKSARDLKRTSLPEKSSDDLQDSLPLQDSPFEVEHATCCRC